MIPSIFENINKHKNCNHHTQYLYSDSTSNCSNDIEEDDINTIIEPEIVQEQGKLTELEKYLRTKVESMNHDIPLPEYLLQTHTKRLSS